MKAHDVLGITLSQLENANDELIRAAHKRKLEELEAINVIELAEYNRRKNEINSAFATLDSKAKRDVYLNELKQPQLVLNTVSTDKDTQSYISSALPTDITRSVQTYQNYITRKIQNLHPSAPTYKESKEQLETFKRNSNPVEENYANFDKFAQSNTYKKLSAEEKNTYSKDHFPSKIITVTYTFSNVDEAIQYWKENEGIEAARKIAASFEKIGVKASPAVLESLNNPTFKEEPTARVGLKI